MRSINDIEPEKFGCFYFTPMSGDISIYLLSPDGDIEYFGYEPFSTSNGTVIAFNYFNAQSTDYAYKLVCNNEEKIIQFQLYENLSGILNNTDSTDNSFFALFGSKSVVSRVEKGEHLFVPLEEHCDKHIYGAAPFFELQDGINTTLLDFTKFTFSNIKSVFPVLAVQGEACIMRIEFADEDGSYRNYPAVTAIAKTLTGLLRMSCEWRVMTKEPFNSTEIPAIKITNMINQLGIDETVEQEIFKSQEPMHVERFITDPENCREIINESGVVPDELKNLIKKQVRYLTLKSLSANTDFAADDFLLLKEKASVEEKIYSFMIYNNVDPSLFSSTSELIGYIKTAKMEAVPVTAVNIYDYLKKVDFL